MVKKIVAGIFCAALLLIGACQKDDEGDPIDKPLAGEASFGVFKLTIDQSQSSISFSGLMKEGPTVMAPWDTVQVAGPLLLLKPAHPFCSGCTGVCVAEDSCAVEPNETQAGWVTISGVKMGNGSTSFVSKPIGTSYSTGLEFADPPCLEGDTISLSAAGSATVAAFDLKVAGIEKLVITSTIHQLVDNQPIVITWEKPKKAGNSRILLILDISYHGGTKAKIVGDCDDNGSVTIPATMLKKLKDFGVSGFPKITMSRVSSSTLSATAKAKMMIEATLEIGVIIPGIESCNNQEDCPDTKICQSDRQCK